MREYDIFFSFVNGEGKEVVNQEKKVATSMGSNACHCLEKALF